MREKVSLKDRTTGPDQDNTLSPEKKAFSSSRSSAHDAPFLQKSIGNRALYGLLRSGLIQPKLKVSRPNDPYEQEADRIAEQVTSIPDSSIQSEPG